MKIVLIKNTYKVYLKILMKSVLIKNTYKVYLLKIFIKSVQIKYL